jgi:hypothetical protein
MGVVKFLVKSKQMNCLNSLKNLVYLLKADGFFRKMPEEGDDKIKIPSRYEFLLTKLINTPLTNGSVQKIERLEDCKS